MFGLRCCKILGNPLFSGLGEPRFQEISLFKGLGASCFIVQELGA